MTGEVFVRVEDKRLRELISTLAPQLRDVVKVAAFSVERRAKQNPTYLDTGATKSSIHTSIAGGESNYSTASSEARSKRPEVRLIPENPPGGDKGLSARVGPSTSYAIFLEFGTHSMAARPFLIPALESEREPFTHAIAEALRKYG